MKFNIFSATSNILNEKRRKTDVATLGEYSEQIGIKSSEFNNRFDNRSICFISEINEQVVSGGVISIDNDDESTHVINYLKYLDLNCKNVQLYEATLDSFQTAVNKSSRNRFWFKGFDEALEKLGIKCLFERMRYVQYSEQLLAENCSKTKLKKQSKELFLDAVFAAESERIYLGGSCDEFSGHPVHYLLNIKDEETENGLSNVILQSLYNVGRLKNRRVCTIEIKATGDFYKTEFRALYFACTGGAIIIKYDAESDNRRYADRANFIEDILCQTAKEHCNNVLTIFCFSDDFEKSKETIIKNLGCMNFVEFKEPKFNDRKQISAALKEISKQHKVSPDKKLYEYADVDNGYTISELKNIWQSWYSKKLRTEIYPQYEKIADCSEPADEKNKEQSALEELNEMICVSQAKEIIQKILVYHNMQKSFQSLFADNEGISMHMTFTGNAGTAKTSVARLYAKILNENGILSGGQLVEVGRSDLVGKYVGWTAKAVVDKFNEAKGGVLFIDEAYSLLDGKRGSFGDEAINTIVQEMENRRHDVVVILAGYPKEMEDFLNNNPGLRSRISFNIHFADYNAEELCDIALLMAKKRDVILTENAVKKMKRIFESAVGKVDFGNGRYVRNVVDLARINQATRLSKLNIKKITEQTFKTIDEEDIELPCVAEAANNKIMGFIY